MFLNDKKKQGNKKDGVIEKYSDLSSSSDDTDYNEEDQMNLKDMFGHNNFYNKNIHDIEQDPYLLSLYQLEQVFIERKRKKEERLRRLRIGRENQIEGSEMELEQEEEVNGLEEIN